MCLLGLPNILFMKNLKVREVSNLLKVTQQLNVFVRKLSDSKACA